MNSQRIERMLLGIALMLFGIGLSVSLLGTILHFPVAGLPVVVAGFYLVNKK